MKLNKKGYTLVELLVSIAVFSIVSIGVISIMSNTLQAYKSSSYETEAQENAQIVSNQLEELLCDATNIGASPTGFTFKSQGTNYTLIYDVADPDNKKLVLNDGSDHVLVENVDNFSMMGWGVNADNKVKYDLTIKVDDKSYEVSRDIYFRNRVEDNDAVDITYLSQTLSTPGPTPDPGVKNVDYNRYDELNLTSEYGINFLGDATHPGGFKKSDGSFDNTVSNTYFNVTVSDNTLTPTSEDADDKVLVLKGTSALNQSFTNGLGGNVVEFVGYKDKTSWEKVTLKIDVKDIAIVNTNAVYQHQYEESTNNGMHTMINVEGIDINKAIAAGVVITYKPYLNTVAGSSKTMTTATSVDKGNNSIHDMPYGNKEVILGLQPDPFGNGMILCSSNETIKSKCDGLQNNDNSYELKFDFSMTNGSTTKSFNDQMKFKFDVLGSGF